jgi:hypothetical protein
MVLWTESIGVVSGVGGLLSRSETGRVQLVHTHGRVHSRRVGWLRCGESVAG